MELPTAQDHNSFYLGGQKVMNLKEMYEAMTNPNNADAAKSHIEGERNDYSIWIKEVLNDEELASKIADKTEVSDIAQLIKEKLDSASAMQTQDQIEPQQPVQQASSDAPMSSSIPQGEQPQESKPDVSEQAAGQPVEEEEESKPEETQGEEKKEEQQQEQKPEETQGEEKKEEEEKPKEGDDKKEEGFVKKMEGEAKEIVEVVEKDAKKVVEGVEEEAKDVIKKVENSARHFCPKFFECMKKEFLFGFGLGIIAGIVCTIIFGMIF